MDATDILTWYADADADTYGDSTDADGDGTADNMVMSCTQPSGYVENTDDCDDTEPLAWTGAAEVCDGVDNDCDGDTDGTAIDQLTWYQDADIDGYGDASVSMDEFVINHLDMSTTWMIVMTLNHLLGQVPSRFVMASTTTVQTVRLDSTDPVDWYLDADQDSYGDANFIVPRFVTQAKSRPALMYTWMTAMVTAGMVVHSAYTLMA